ncbi:uncharacterized protein BDW47DRAFT_126440 [Aspergillus candidus]|uniref:Uncharacterized protein n=1 Tax=Aspergillus candidus TaxID=41067 RepID=A0A2I2F9D8_ASPCN|nr:hypothetical protein BDW47DRAFT_126440 [Aspergillus candidus]PLB37239.1 hypothetical protein BDW47DRAFT_126440 [Aspergillus candidus]
MPTNPTKLLLPLASLLLLQGSITSACEVWSGVQHTFYGYPDNDPPGAAISQDCGRGFTAGGTGTFSDPLTMATAPGELENCEVVYVPFLKKYLRNEDYCAQCVVDWQSGLRHIDVWTGESTVNGGEDQINCEKQLTTAESIYTIVRSPRGDLEVDPNPIYTPDNDGQTCHADRVYPGFDSQQFC